MMMSATPLGVAPASATCYKCGLKGKALSCSNCKLARYCSVQCQKASWSSHRKFCKSNPDQRNQLLLEALTTAPISSERIMGAVRNVGPNFPGVMMGGGTFMHDFVIATAMAILAEQLEPGDVCDMLTEILELGPDLRRQTPKGDTPLHLACRQSNGPFIETVLSQANADFDLSARNDEGNTAEDCLQEAAMSNPWAKDCSERFHEHLPFCKGYLEFRKALRTEPLEEFGMHKDVKKVETNHGVGYVAKKDIQPGTLLLREVALAVGASDLANASFLHQQLLAGNDDLKRKLQDLWPRSEGIDLASSRPECAEAIAAIVTRNGFSMFSYENCVKKNEDEVPSGLFYQLSFFNHSCDPNVYTEFVGNFAFARTTRLIAEGEELMISYLAEPEYCLAERHKSLQGWDFVCDCQRCRDEGADPQQFTPLSSAASTALPGGSAHSVAATPSAMVLLVGEMQEIRKSRRFVAGLSHAHMGVLHRYISDRWDARDKAAVIKGHELLCWLVEPCRFSSKMWITHLVKLVSACTAAGDTVGSVEAMRKAVEATQMCLGAGMNLLFDRYSTDLGTSSSA